MTQGRVYPQTCSATPGVLRGVALGDVAVEALGICFQILSVCWRRCMMNTDATDVHACRCQPSQWVRTNVLLIDVVVLLLGLADLGVNLLLLQLVELGKREERHHTWSQTMCVLLAGST